MTAMRSKGFWSPLTVSLVATPLCLLLGFASAGAGHGDYVLATILFPYSAFLIFFFGGWVAPFVSIAIAVAQFPLYGIILEVASGKRRLRPWAACLLVVHTLAAIACFAVRIRNGFL